MPLASRLDRQIPCAPPCGPPLTWAWRGRQTGGAADVVDQICAYVSAPRDPKRHVGTPDPYIVNNRPLLEWARALSGAKGRKLREKDRVRGPIGPIR
eukprot:2259133-Pyramimonas_sp.AAC.1